MTDRGAFGCGVVGFDPGHRLRARLPIDAGRIARHPFVRVGRGSRPLVIVPGLNDPLTRVTDAPWFAASAAGYCARYAGIGGGDGSRQVYMVSRPVETPSETVREMAGGYAAVLAAIAAEHDARIDLLGLSMGGFVAGHLAAIAPDQVGRLVFGLAGARLSDEGSETIARWGRWAARDEWGPIYREAVDAVSLGHRRRALRIAARGYDTLTDGPRHPAAFRAEVRACLAHDGRDELEGIETPTLVIGADADPFFSAREYRETASALPEGSVRVLPGIGHQAVLERRRAFDAAVNGFLSGAGNR